MNDEFDHTRAGTEQDKEGLTLVNGFELKDDGKLVTQVVFDGEIVTFRSKDGDLAEMGILCYLDFVMRETAQQVISEDGRVIHPTGIDPGVVLCTMVAHLHEQWHTINRGRQLRELLGGEGGLAELLAGLGGGGLVPVGAFAMGPDGNIEQVAGPDLGALLGGEPPAANENAETTDDGIKVEGGFPFGVVDGGKKH